MHEASPRRDKGPTHNASAAFPEGKLIMDMGQIYQFTQLARDLLRPIVSSIWPSLFEKTTAGFVIPNQNFCFVPSGSV